MMIYEFKKMLCLPKHVKGGIPLFPSLEGRRGGFIKKPFIFFEFCGHYGQTLFIYLHFQLFQPEDRFHQVYLLPHPESQYGPLSDYLQPV